MSVRYYPRGSSSLRHNARSHRRRSFSEQTVWTQKQPEPVAKPRGQSYLPALDGIRALAVLAVIVYHARPDWLPGGFLGVDVFFAISGFIITRALLTEWRETRRVNIRRFYLRRAQRLLPALLLVVVAVLAYTLAFQPHDVARLRGDAIAAALQVANWHFVLAHQSYFESFARPSSLRHLWSLAVEEQFYLVWPLLLTLGLRFLKPHATLLIVLLAAVASTCLMAYLHWHGASASRLYYGSDTRAAGLLVGAGLALAATLRAPSAEGKTMALWRSLLLDVAGLGALAGLCAAVFFLGESNDLLYQGGFGLVALSSAVLIMAASNHSGLLSRLLKLSPLRWIGQRSYGIYLWHWPLALLTWPELPSPVQMLAEVAAAITIAAISYKLVERPIRDGKLAAAIGKLRGPDGYNLPQKAGFVLATACGIAGIIVLGVLVSNSRPAEVPPYLAAGSVRLINRPAPVAEAAVPVAPAPVAAPAVEPPAPEVTVEPSPPVEAAVPESPAPVTTSTSVVASAGDVAKVAQAPRAPAAAPIMAAATTPLVTVIGDSVLLGAANELAYRIPQVDIDAAVGRQADQAIYLLYQRYLEGSLGNIIVVDIGNNGTFNDKQFDQIMTIAGPQRRVVFVNNKVPRRWQDSNNAVIDAGVAYYPNTVLVDWYAEGSARPDFFWDDAVHLRPEGAATFANLIVAAITR